MNLDNFTHAFIVPGKPWVIDMVDPTTGLTLHNRQTLAQVRADRYPEAVLVNLDEWQQERGAEQDSPVTWEETTEQQYMEMLNVLPPAFWHGGLFLVGEPSDHHAVTGAARFHAYWQRGRRFFAASRPVTRKEADAMLRSRAFLPGNGTI